ncbi:hypothetical protein TSUD_181510 [Trifolium subterraneum]|uniref:Uncharacterized protein n=1 Tax=Trifolium subterraneum TaxID=3900 RepID=A0A2Z6NK13_TRISU|nr:hypothetical protein TSUD_181510 [Trifolium subterraneum]
MASRLILQNKRNLLFTQHTRYILVFSSIEIGRIFESSELDGLSRFPFSSSRTTKQQLEQHERNLCTVNKDDLVVSSVSRFYLHRPFGGSNFGIRTEKIESVSLLRLGWTSQSVYCISTTSANQSRLSSSSGGNEQSDTKQKKEASPEECDEAVEDFSTVKVKAKAKQLQEEPHRSTDLLNIALKS